MSVEKVGVKKSSKQLKKSGGKKINQKCWNSLKSQKYKIGQIFVVTIYYKMNQYTVYQYFSCSENGPIFLAQYSDFGQK